MCNVPAAFFSAMTRGRAERSSIHLFLVFFSLILLLERESHWFFPRFTFNSEIWCKEMSEIDTFMSMHTHTHIHSLLLPPERWMNNVEQDVWPF